MHNLSSVRSSRRPHRSRLALFVTLAALAGVLASAPRSWALGGGDVSVTMTTDPLLVFDTNVCATGPNAAYVVFRITNTSGGTLTGLEATLGGFAVDFGLAAGQPATQPIGTLAAGESAQLAWDVTYPCTDGQSDSLDVTVADDNPGTVVGSAVVTTKASLSANAGGLIVSSLVTPSTPTLGGLVEYDVTYSFGSTSVGDTFNLQPAGNLTGYDADCFQLIDSEILASAVTAIPVGSPADLYFTAVAAQAGSGHQVTVRYVFRVRCAGTAATALPYSSVTSGVTTRYSGNYGSVDSTPNDQSLPAATEPFELTKTASPTSATPGATVLYTVELANTSTEDASIDRIVDVLPAGASFGTLVTGASCSANPNQVDLQLDRAADRTARPAPSSSSPPPRGSAIPRRGTWCRPADRWCSATR